MKKVFSLMACGVIIALLPTGLFAQEAEVGFAVNIGGASIDQSNTVAIDGSGNSFVAGRFYGELTLGDSVYSSAGVSDGFLAKLDSQGEVLWSVAFGGVGADECHAVATDNEGNSYVAGYLGSTGVNIQNETISSLGGYDVLVMKFSPDGVLLWARTYGSATNDQAKAITIDNNGIVTVVGYFQASMVVGASTLVSSFGLDAFVLKLNANGDPLWAAQAGGPGQTEARAVAVDPSGNTYISGFFYGNEVSAGDLTATGAGVTDIFLVKYDAAGTVLDLKTYGSVGSEGSTSLAANLDGDIFLAGYFENTVQIGSQTLISNGNLDMFVVKFDGSLNAIWSQSIGSTGGDLALDLSIHSDGGCFFTGLFYATVMAGDFELQGGGTLVARLNSIGQFNWAIRFANAGIDLGGRGIASNAEGAVTVSGNFNQPFEIGGIEVLSSGSTDAYVVRIDNVFVTDIGERERVINPIVFPNPGVNYLQVQGISTPVQVQILNTSGQVVVQQFLNTNSDFIDVSALPAGTYILSAEGNGYQGAARVVIIR
jgi:hypothetical protein